MSGVALDLRDAAFRGNRRSARLVLGLCRSSTPRLSLYFVNGRSIESAYQPSGIAACRGQDRVVVHGDEFAIARDQIANQCGLATLTWTRNHDNRRVLERGGHQ